MKTHSASSDKWTKEQRIYMEWEALPKSERKPKTIEALAPQLGVTSRTIRKWKQLPGFWDEVKNEGRASLQAAIAEIYRALIKQAKDGSFQHLKLALEMAGEHTDKLQIQTTWMTPLISHVIDGTLHYSTAVDELGESLAQDLFKEAGVNYE